jgi:hypothetical protein
MIALRDGSAGGDAEAAPVHCELDAHSRCKLAWIHAAFNSPT